MAAKWTPEVEDLPALGTSGTLLAGGAKAIPHVTTLPVGAKYGDPKWFDIMVRVLRSKEAEPHYLIDPFTDRCGQFFPLDRSARALKRGWGYDVPWSCNKMGSRVIQIEFISNPVPAFTDGWRPGPNFRAMMRDIRDNGVPPVFAPQRLASTPSNAQRMSWNDYVAFSGWVGHSVAPLQDHWDPGPINTKEFFAKAYGAEATQQEDDMPYTEAQLKKIIGDVVDEKLDATNKNVAELQRDIARIPNTTVKSLLGYSNPGHSRYDLWAIIRYAAGLIKDDKPVNIDGTPYDPKEKKA